MNKEGNITCYRDSIAKLEKGMGQQRDYVMKVVLGTACVMYDMETLTDEATITDRKIMEFQIIQGKGREEQSEDCKPYLI
jgi:hypothetical protein